MAWTDLKASIARVIRTNGNQEITGALLQLTLNTIVDQLGADATLKGVATPATTPNTTDRAAFYIASELGTYANFGGLKVNSGEIAVFYSNGTEWTKMSIDLTQTIAESISDSATTLMQEIENLQSLLDGKADSNVIEQINNSVETLSAHPSDNIRHVTQQDKEYWNGKADVTVKGSWKTAALHAHYFASSAINKYAVGKYIPLIRLVSNNIGKMDCYFDIIAREFGEYQSYFGRFMFTGGSETAKLTCLDYFDNGLGRMLSADDICFKLEGNIATIYRKISNTPESPANTDYFIVSVWGENTSTYSTQNYYTTAGMLEPNELQLLEAVDVTGATVAVLANDYGSVEMASSTADVLKEKTLYFIPNNNAYDGYVRHISNTITYFEKVIEGASLKNHIDNKVMHLNTITIPTGNNGTSKCFKIMSIDDCSNFSNFTLLSNYVNDIGMVSNMSIDMLGIYDDSYGHKVFEHHVLGTSQVYCNKRTHMEEEQEILDGVDVYLYTTFFQNSNIVVTLLQGQNLLTDDITFGNLGTEEWGNLQNVVSKKRDILQIDSVEGLQDKLNEYQKITDNTLETNSKTVPGAINEVLGLKQRAYTLDFGTDSELAQDSNLLGSITINQILTQNVSTLYLSYGSVVRQSVPTSGTVSLQIPDSTILTWEIVRATENEPACVGIRFEILI